MRYACFKTCLASLSTPYTRRSSLFHKYREALEKMRHSHHKDLRYFYSASYVENVIISCLFSHFYNFEKKKPNLTRRINNDTDSLQNHSLQNYLVSSKEGKFVIFFCSHTLLIDYLKLIEVHMQKVSAKNCVSI